MVENRRKDIILLIAAGALVLLIFLPFQKIQKTEDTPLASRSLLGGDTTEAPVEPASGSSDFEVGVSDPITDIPHLYLPLTRGSTWEYRVTGPPVFVKNPKWSMTLVSLPSGDNPGTVTVGFAGAERKANIWLQEGGVRFDGLSFMEPLEFLENRPLTLEGFLLPIQESILMHGLWVQRSTREVIYRFRNKKNKDIEMPAAATQTDRAHIKDQEFMTVPAGTFKSWRIAWLSRIEIKADDRPVLKNLTSEPFRNETMWIAPGIGIIRRKIRYTSRPDDDIEFSLLRYYRPETHKTKGTP